MKEIDLIKEKASRCNAGQCQEEIARIESALPKAQGIAARKRYETRLDVYLVRLSELCPKPSAPSASLRFKNRKGGRR